MERQSRQADGLDLTGDQSDALLPNLSDIWSFCCQSDIQDIAIELVKSLPYGLHRVDSRRGLSWLGSIEVSICICGRLLTILPGAMSEPR